MGRPPRAVLVGSGLVAGAALVLAAVAAGRSPAVRSWWSHLVPFVWPGAVERADAPPGEAVPRADPTGAAAGPPHGAGVPSPGPPRAALEVDPRRLQLIGVRLARVERAMLVKTIRAPGLVRYDETRLVDVNVKLDGWIEELYVNYTGQFVRRGDPLLALYSPDLVTTQQEYLLALRGREALRESTLGEARQEAEQLVRAARQRLEYWGLAASEIEAIEREGVPRRTMLFRAPASGVVVEKHAFKGLHVQAGQSLYRLADLSVVWIEADLYEHEAPFVRVGDRATVRIDALAGDTFSGRLVYVYPFVEPQTRTVRVRLAVANPSGRLRPGMYARVDLRFSLGTGLVVPTDAVLESGTDQVVFVSRGGGVFEPRRVRVGHRLGDRVQIRDGVAEGEQVATGAAFFLDSESQLRAALRGFEAVAPGGETVSGGSAELAITLSIEPDPPRAGSNVLAVVVKDRAGRPVTDATVVVAFFMPPMPSMNMPAMRSEATLTHVGGGLYRGRAQIPMAGRWEVSVTVTRHGQRLGATQMTLVAR